MLQQSIRRQSNSFGRSILQMLPSGGTTELTRYHRDYLSVDERQWMYDLDQQVKRIFLACTRLWATSETRRIEVGLGVFWSGA
jgi:hypothetical protein